MYDEYQEIEHRLVCTRTSALSEPIKGSTESTCGICGQLVWIAPSTLNVILEHTNLVKYCTECAKEAMERGE